MMKRKLIMQMRNEWRSNIWMMVELLIVGLVIWFMFLILGTLINTYQKPVGADYSDLYVGGVGYISEEAESYKPYDDDHSYATDLAMLMANLSAKPDVEIVGRGTNALPYSYNYYGYAVKSTIDGKKVTYGGNSRYMTPETIKAIRLRGVNGETPDELAEIIANGGILLSEVERSYGESADPARLRGKDVILGNDSSTIYNVGAVINPIRRSDFEPCSGVIIKNDDRKKSNEIIIRVKEGRGRQFMESLSGTDLEFGNVYINNLQSLAERREDAHREIGVTVRNTVTGAVFVLVSIFLGFLGTFWYRTQQRVPELALRMTNGATHADLFRRFLSEGLLLLVIPAVIMIPAGLYLFSLINEGDSVTEIYIDNFLVPAHVVWLAFAAAVAALALMIIAGIWMPARRAMKVEPAVALKDQ